MGNIDGEVEDYDLYIERFASRLYALRNKAGVSAREMSLALNRNHAYINSIENRKYLPTMKEFFGICDYLSISPSEFLITITGGNNDKLSEIHEMLAYLNANQISAVHTIVSDLTD